MSEQDNLSDWTSLIRAVSRDLEEARLRVAKIEAALTTFKRCRQRGDPFPGQADGAECESEG